MADETPIRLVKPILPPGFCMSPANIIGLFNQLLGFLPGTVTVLNQGPDEPTIENRNKLWVKTDDTTGIPVGLYAWAPTLGVWAKNHWNSGILPTSLRVIFVGAAADVDTFDGGESGTVSVSTGPFWEIDTDYNDKIPVGVGTNFQPVGADFTQFATAATDPPVIRATYFLKPTGRLYDRA